MFLFFVFLVIPLLLIAGLAWLGSNYLLARREPDEADSPANYGLVAEAAEYRSGDGITLRGWYIPFEGSVKTIIVCSGANGSLDADLPVAPWLHEAGFNVLLFDWRAHGKSDGEVVTLGYNERYDLIAAVEFVLAQGAQRVGVLGFSMGGSIALATAAVYEPIHAVVADSPFVFVLSAVAGGLLERGWPDSLSYVLARLFLVTACLRTRLNLFQTDPARWVQRISPRPVLLLFGQQDVIVPPSEVDQLVARTGEPRDVWRVPEAGHRAIAHLHPDEYQRRILSFFVANL